MNNNDGISERYGTLITICFASIQVSVAFIISIVSAFHVKKCHANERALKEIVVRSTGDEKANTSTKSTAITIAEDAKCNGTFYATNSDFVCS